MGLRAGVVSATALGHLGPRSVDLAFRYDEVPRLQVSSRFTLAIKVPRLFGSMRAEGLEVLLFDEELFPVLIQEEAHPSGRERGASLQRVVDDGGQVEELDHLERPPDLLPSTAEIRRVEQVDERSLERRYADAPAGKGLGHDSAAEIGEPVECARRADSDEIAALERERADVAPSQNREPMPD